MSVKGISFSVKKDIKMTLPNYFHVGQGRAGSTTLHFMLRDHPDVCLVKGKEAHFFNNDILFEKGLEHYKNKFFSHYNGEKIVGDITPAYHLPEYMNRIVDNLGKNIRTSICFRFPVARSFSHYFFDVRTLEQPKSFKEAVIDNPIYIEASRGGKSLDNISKRLPAENILPLIFERDIKAKNASVAYNKLLKFLDIAPHKTIAVPKGGGFLPRITGAKKDGFIYDSQHRKKFKKGDIIIETLERSTEYKVKIISSPNDKTREFYETYYDKVTLKMDQDDVRACYDQYFSADVALLKDLLKEDIPEWNFSNFKKLSAPPVLESRLDNTPKWYVFPKINLNKIKKVARKQKRKLKGS